MGCIYGTINLEETAELKEFSPLQAFDFERCVAGRKDLDSEKVW